MVTYRNRKEKLARPTNRCANARAGQGTAKVSQESCKVLKTVFLGCHCWLVQQCLTVTLKHCWTSQQWHPITWQFSCEASRLPRKFAACLMLFASCVLCLNGCNKPTGELSSRLETEVLLSADSGKKQETLSRVEPGTLLEEAEFKKTLLAAGAELVVVQVYLDACGPCITEALKLTQMQPKWHSQGVTILGLGMDETAAGPKSFFDSTGGRINFPLYLAPWFAKQQQVEATPVLFIYSASGEQLHRSDPFNAEINAVDEISEKLSELLAKQ